MTVIETDNLTLQIGHFHLQHIDIKIPKGKITAIIGPNGSGKSTLLKVISRLLTHDTGDVRVEGRSAKQYKAKEFAQILSMLPQSKNSLPNLTVRELVSYGRAPYKKIFEARLTANDEAFINWAMEVTGTKKFANRMYTTLSGGEQQKVRIALTLAQNTSIILLDEPTTYLDIAHQLDVMEMLKEINETYHFTIVMVLHELQQAAAYSNFLIAMKQGKIAAFGSPKELLTPQFLKDVYDIDALVKYEGNYPLIIPRQRNLSALSI